VVALSPALLRERAAELAEARVNVVVQGPRGFAPLGVETLSDDPDLVESSVRRLLTFLRRVALDRGASWVFEPHDATLQRAVDAAFNGLLGDLFQRGAFAGKDAASAYRVVTDVAVNPPPSIDAGRLVVELRVAPSVPLRFLTVRLVQQGARAAAAEVR
jgi:phage tail sheath protein FI